MNKKTEELEEIIGYHFKNKHYLTQALTHSSYANEKKLGKLGSNERLEFLGDLPRCRKGNLQKREPAWSVSQVLLTAQESLACHSFCFLEKERT